MENYSQSESDAEDYKKNKPIKKKKNLGKILSQIVKRNESRIDKKLKADKTIILSRVKEPFKKIEEEKKELKEHKEKQKIRLVQKTLGYKKIPKWEKTNEKKLKKLTTKGVVKLFNSIFEFRKKARDEKEKEEKAREKKSTNFLMMHNLDPKINSNKSFKEDQG